MTTTEASMSRCESRVTCTVSHTVSHSPLPCPARSCPALPGPYAKTLWLALHQIVTYVTRATRDGLVFSLRERVAS